MCAFVRILKSEVLPACGSPMIPLFIGSAGYHAVRGSRGERLEENVSVVAFPEDEDRRKPDPGPRPLPADGRSAGKRRIRSRVGARTPAFRAAWRGFRRGLVLPQQRRDLGGGFVVVPDQEVAAPRELLEARSGYVLGRVARAVVGPVEIVRHADRERRDGDPLELVTGKLPDHRLVVEQAGAALGDRQDLPQHFGGARSLGARRVLDYPRRGPGARPVAGGAGEAARGPEKEVGFQRRLEEETGSFRDPHRRRASFARRESRRNEEDERRRPVGMTQRELHGGGSARGGAEDRRAIDSE